ncbi:histone-lysine N-methyltransferase SETMAR [Trichonephila clavipes]|nr:histone-lysine N-methyltransferase SETMAR [Trichonephila clavipes]
MQNREKLSVVGKKCRDLHAWEGEKALCKIAVSRNQGECASAVVREIRRKKNLLRGPMCTKGIPAMIKRFKETEKLGVQHGRGRKRVTLVLVDGVKTAVDVQSQASKFWGNSARTVSRKTGYSYSTVRKTSPSSQACKSRHSSPTTDVAAVAEWSRYRIVGWPCREFEPSTTKDPPCRAVMHVKSVKSSNVIPLFLPDNTTINSEVYCHQLDKLNDALQQKRSELINRKGVVLHQDNAKPHTSLVSRQKLLQLEWDTMPHPPYSPDLAPSDYYLFRSPPNFLDGKTFTSNEEVKNHLDQFFASKDQKFYERGIMLLPEKWQKVLDQNGQYII